MALVALWSTPALAASGTWNGTTDAFWATASNWSGASAPGSGETATFNNAGNGNTTLDLGAGVTVSSIVFDTASAAAYTIGSGGPGVQTLTLNAGGGVTMNSTVAVDELLNASLVLGTAAGANSFTFTNNSPTNSLSFAGGISSTTTGIKTLTVPGSGATNISGAITNGTGTLALIKSGTGVLTLSGPNTFSGGITIQRDGVLRSGADNALPPSNVTVAAGTLDLNGYSGTIGSGAGNAIWFYTTGGAYNLTNTISTGSGTLTLNGNIGVDSDARTIVNLISGKLNLGAATRTVSNASYGGVGHSAQMTPIHISADISGAPGAGITSSNGGAPAMLRLSGNNSYTGTTTISAGYLQADSATALGNGGNITFANSTSCVLQYTANSAGADWSTRFKNSTGAVRLDTNGQTVTLAGIIDNTNTGGLTKLGAGTLILAGANTYSGTTTVNAGTLRSGANDVVPAGAIVSGNAAGVTATWDLNGNSETVSSLQFGGSTATSGAAVTTGAGTLTLAGDVTYSAANNPLGGTLSGNLSLGALSRTFTVGESTTAADDLTVSAAITGSAAAGLTKAGAGRLTLSGTNTYPGSTTVNDGLLMFNAPASIAGSGRNITVTSPGAVAINYVPATTIQDDLLSRIVSTSNGAVALTANTSENFDFSSGGPGNNFIALFLGAVGNVTYSGTLTPNGTTYRLGGGGGTLTVANANALTGSRSLVVGGSVILPAANDFTGTTTINSGATLQLGTGAAGQNGSVASTSIVDNGTLVFNNADPQSYGGVISGSGGLTKSGGGTLTLTAPQTYAGTTTVNAGTLALRGGDHTLAVNKTLTVNGGTLDLGGNAQYVGNFTGTGGVVTGSGLFTTNAANGSFAGQLNGSLSFVKAGGNTLTLTGASATTGTLGVLGGGVTLKDSGAFTAAAAINVRHATLTLDNTGTQDVADRINDAVPIALRGGAIVYNGRNSTASTETLGAVTAASGVSLLAATPGSGTASAVLTLGSLSRSQGAVLRINGTNLGTSSNPYGRVLVSGGLAGNLTPVNGVVPGVFDDINTDTWAFVGYDATKGFGPLGTAGYPGTKAGLDGAVGTDNVTGGGTVAASMAINSYNQGALAFANGTPAGGPDLLTVNSGLMVIGYGSENLGADAAHRGRITSGTSELFIAQRDGNNNGYPYPAVHAVIEDNGGPVSLAIWVPHRDRGWYTTLTAPNTYSGGTFVTGGPASQGGILLNGSGVTIPAGGLTINNNGLVSMIGAAGQIDPSNTVTLNGGGELRLMGTNTLAGIVFNSDGGTNAPKVIPYNTVNAPTAYSDVSGAGNGTLVITGNITSTPSNVAATPIIGQASGNGVGILDLNGTAAHDIDVAALPEGNFVNTLTPLIGLKINSLIQNGGFTKKGGGVLNLTNAGSNYSGQLTVENGVLNVAAVNNVSANGPLGNSASSVILGKTGGLTGTIEYTAGNATSGKPFTMAAGGTGAFQVDTAATVLTLSGLIDGGGGLAKTGPGTLTLSNVANTYGGPTTVSAGTLKLSAAAATNNIASTSAISVGGGATLDVSTLSGATIVLSQPLSAKGAGMAAVTGSVNAGGYNLDLQDGANLGTLAISGGLTLGGGGTLKFDLGATASDRITIGTTASLAGTTHVNLNSIAGITSLATGAHAYTLATAASGDLSSGFTLDTASLTVNGLPYNFTLDPTTGGLYLNVFAGPGTSSLTLPGTSLTLNVHKDDVATTVGTTVTNGATLPSHFTATSTGSDALTLNPSTSTAIAGGPGATSPLTARWSSTGAAGARSGQITITNDDNGSDSATPKTQAVTGGVYNLAAAAAGQTVNVGAFHVGVGKTAAVTLTNTALANATYTETLQTNGFSGTSANFTAAGSASGIPGGGSGSGSLLVGAGAGLGAGPQSGSTTLALQSQQVNGSGLGTTNIAAQTITINATGYNLASTSFNTTSVDLGTIHANGSFTSQALSIDNTLPAGTYNETLGAQFANASGVTTGGAPVTVAAGAPANTSMTVNLSASTATAGHKTGTVDVQFDSREVNSSGLGTTSRPALNKTITVGGDVFGGSATWALSAGPSGSWGAGASANWSGAAGINAAPGTFAGYDNVDAATFDGTGSTATVNLDAAAPSLKSLAFSGGTSYQIAQGSGTSKLTLKSDAGSATVSVSGVHAISAPVTLATSTAVTVTGGGDRLTLNGAVDGTGSLTLSGAGRLVLGGNNFTAGHSGGTAASGGTLQLDSANALLGGSNLTLTGSAKAALGGSSTVNLGSAVKLADLSLNAHATSGLTAALDLNKSKLIVDKTQVPVATIRAQIKSAYASARWTGAGIGSAAAAADYAANASSAKTAVGYLDNGLAPAQGGGKTTWQGRSVNSNSVLVRFTYYGDCNLDGSVNLADFGIFKLNYGTGSQWYQGDFNYDGAVNLGDFGKLKQAYGSTPIAAGEAVPEPAAAAMLCLWAPWWLARRFVYHKGTKVRRAA